MDDNEKVFRALVDRAVNMLLMAVPDAEMVHSSDFNPVKAWIADATAALRRPQAHRPEEKPNLDGLREMLKHSLDNTDEALRHMTALTTTVLAWCEAEADGHHVTAHTWRERAALLREQLEADARIDAEAHSSPQKE